MTTQTHILIVDDEANFRNTLAKILEKKGFVTTIAEDGPHAIELVKEKSFGIILMDVKMPVMSGIEAYKIIKQIRPSVTVIFMTAFSVADLVKDVINEGAYAMLSKPIDIDAVVNMINKSKGGALITIVDDNPDIGTMIQSALGKNGYTTTTCLTGEDAIALAKDRPRNNIFIIDLKLPVLNGLETYLEIKKIDPDAVAVMMTGYRHEMDELVRMALKEGAYSCLFKPFEMDTVVQVIENIFTAK